MKKIKELLNKHSGIMEAVRFAFSGGVCFVVEYVVLIALKELFQMNVVLATAIAFLVSVAVNYLMCVRWVFNDAKEASAATTIGFMVTSAAGLVLNMAIMWVLTSLWGEEMVLFSIFGMPIKIYMADKALATLLVMIWNYFSKRKILRKQNG